VEAVWLDLAVHLVGLVEVHLARLAGVIYVAPTNRYVLPNSDFPAAAVSLWEGRDNPLNPAVPVASTSPSLQRYSHYAGFSVS
jgi:hypothetical protein